jgi:hypothetical protein
MLRSNFSTSKKKSHPGNLPWRAFPKKYFNKSQKINKKPQNINLFMEASDILRN